MLDRPYGEDASPQSDPSEGEASSNIVDARKHASAVAHLYEDHAEQLSRYLRREYGDGPPDPDEVMQEAFARLYEHRSLGTIKNLRAFLWRIARNLVLDGKRHIEARSKYDYEIENLFFALDSTSLSPENVLYMREQLHIVNQVLSAMPERRRKAFLWHRVDGLNFVAVAKRLGVNRRHVAKQIAQAAFDIETALNAAPGSDPL
ncbi:MAG: sigma-70 family RNA polymerase sigma factor [Pseudomonadota bacterium]